jgi:hypothetical protein
MAKGRPKNTAQSFWRHVDRRGQDECWPWKIATKNGYGRFSLNCVEHYAHRFAYGLTYGRAPEGRETHVMHTCNNKLCCNPAHLELGSALENTRAATRDGLMSSGETHHSARYSDALIRTILADRRPQLELERVYGVSQTHISLIKRGRARRGVYHG